MIPVVSLLFGAEPRSARPAGDTAGFRQALPGHHYDFPRDHFNHPEFRTEWWYYTGNVRSAGGNRFGFELVFFRQGQRRSAREAQSTWNTDDLYLAHLALSDLTGKHYHFTKRLNRAGPGIAGVSFEQGRIWNGNWESRWDLASGTQTLTAVADDIRFHLRLTPRQPPVIEGENGVSQKAAGAGQASHYVSFPLLEVDGTVNGASVAGTAWMDHEWFSNQLAANEIGWDWFSVQLADGDDLMLFDLRRTDGSIDPYSSGTFIGRDGRATHLRRADFELTPLEFWTSRKTGARYPVKWRISVPSRAISLECTAAVQDQELASEDSPGLTYWEGAVSYSGSSNGVGYLEMTGYSAPVKIY